jgi:hypothetical protein
MVDQVVPVMGLLQLTGINLKSVKIEMSIDIGKDILMSLKYIAELFRRKKWLIISDMKVIKKRNKKDTGDNSLSQL